MPSAADSVPPNSRQQFAAIVQTWRDEHWSDFLDCIGLKSIDLDTVMRQQPVARLVELKRILLRLTQRAESDVLRYLLVAACAYARQDPVPLMSDLREGFKFPNPSMGDGSSLAAMPPPTSVDVAVITIREDEFEAMLDRLPGYQHKPGAYWDYQGVSVVNDDQTTLNVAVGRTLDQGSLAAQALAIAMIMDLKPRWILVVGIAGGIPASDYSLGDVLLSQRVHDFTVSAKAPGKPLEFQDLGGPMSIEVEKLLANLPANKAKLGEWTQPQQMKMSVPRVQIPESTDDSRLAEPDSSKQAVIQCLKSKFQSTIRDTAPKSHIGPIIDASTLVKDTEMVDIWQKTARHACGIEMELAGVYRAARHFGKDQTRVLGVRGISDIVGFKRGPEWTQYACHSAASFANALIRSGLLKAGK